MTGNRSQLMNFVSRFLGTVRFGNDQIAKIMGYGDYQLGNVTISQAADPVQVADPPVQEADAPVSTSIDQDAPSTSIPSSKRNREHSPNYFLKTKGETSFGSRISARRRNPDFDEYFASVQIEAHPVTRSKCRSKEYDDLPNGRQNCFLKWRAQRRGLCFLTRRIC
ncbi:hypothetical protein Tco_0989509 [Tanacetum coccineum]|uniref:Integrase, catalytic region, zinc finger, CCHC-type, peptidase aspartic, catalytic n=1 Tax=Tanacetum coccineum TaxID=301880 RepID=A0ABQ5EU59_9ASTR